MPFGEGMLVATRDGRLIHTDADGRILAAEHPDDVQIVGLDVIDSRQGAAALTAGHPRQLLIVGPDLALTASYDLPEGCLPRGVATTPTRFVVACGNAHVAEIDRRTGEVHATVTSASTIQVTAVGETVYVRDQIGPILPISDGAERETFLSTLCPVTTSELTQASNRLFVAGPGTAGACYLSAYDLPEGDRHGLPFPWVEAPRSQALTASPDGRFVAYGFDDGTVWVLDLTRDDIITAFINRDLGDQVRGLAFTPDGGSLTAVSRDGRVMTLDVHDDPVAVNLARAAEIVERAETVWPTDSRPRFSSRPASERSAG